VKRLALLISAVLIGTVSVQAQSSPRFGNGGDSVGALVADGFEIKSVVLNNGKYIVFLQKERKAFACEFSRVNKSRCGEIQ
jgi:hypothetical protein